MVINYPDLYDAPMQLLALEGGCGVIAAWSVCKYFHKRVSASQLIKSCRYTKRHGVFTIAMAVALHELGLSITFHTDPDAEPKSIEKRCYKIANSLGIPVMPGIDLDALIDQIDTKSIVIVLYKTQPSAHFSPLLGIKDSKLLLPYSYAGEMKKNEFTINWDDPEICRQCIVVSRK